MAHKSTSATTPADTSAAPIDTTATTAPLAQEDTTPAMQETPATDTAPAVEPQAPAVEIAPAVRDAIAALAQIDTALAVLSADNPATATLHAARETALGTLALAEAQSALDIEKTARIAAVESLDMPAPVIADMLAAIERHYAPAPTVEDAPAPVQAPVLNGRRPIGAVASERNATVASALAVDSDLLARANATIAVWRGSADDASCVAQKLAGTRYAGLVALASGGAGVANRADYVVLSTAIRLRLQELGFRVGGQTVISSVWLACIGPHAVGAVKGNDSLTVSMGGGYAVALYPDGRFRLAPIGTAGVRFIGADSAAYAQFNGGTASASAAPAPTQAPATAPVAPKAPTPPTQAAQSNGALTSTARCQHCTARNFVTSADCASCGAADWHIVGGVKLA
jgi:hypothetical protein